ncbi:hypothetical protein MNBD_GAMMA23-836 [hydrothermal vent metagenome]|uniref:Uncharacterized protein n=1 Tax=hydrothermal vent metagenome TaxID=652676 RepID=A0A3B0ZHY0_9ZZZZ
MLWKKHYCEHNFEKCKRYHFSLEGKVAPLTLLPNGKMLEKRTSTEINAAALFNAIEKKRIPVVKSILKIGVAGENLQTSEGLSPLMAAASVGSEELVELMLVQGCNPWKKTTKGKTALDYAVMSGNVQCENLIRAQLQASPKEEFNITQVVSQTELENTEKSFVIKMLQKLNPFKSSGDA